MWQLNEKSSHGKRCILMPIMTVKFQTTRLILVSLPKEACDTDLPSSLKKKKNPKPSASFYRKQTAAIFHYQSVWGRALNTWLNLRLAQPKHGSSANQSKPRVNQGRPERASSAARAPRTPFCRRRAPTWSPRCLRPRPDPRHRGARLPPSDGLEA